MLRLQAEGEGYIAIFTVRKGEEIRSGDAGKDWDATFIPKEEYDTL